MDKFAILPAFQTNHKNCTFASNDNETRVPHSNSWKSSCCNALAHSLEVVVGSVKCYLWEVWKLSCQNFTRRLEHKVATISFAHAAQNHDMVDLVELCVLRQAITQVD